MEQINVTGMTLEQMESLMLSIGQPKYRATQLFTWVYKKGITAFDEMSNFSKSLRQQLSDLADIGYLTLQQQIVSTDGQAIKFLFRLADGLYLESVYMIEGKRRTVCLSTQVGCTLKCRFCATGAMGFRRNLTAGEIVDQLLWIRRTLGVDVTNVVIMGMGEPFLNYEATIAACKLISHDQGIAIGKRKITISTSGIVPAIMQYADEGHGFKLAISLNAADDAKRSEIMPINRKYPLAELMQAARYYSSKSRQRVTFEYVLLAGVNDQPEDARRLSQLIKNLRCKINLIPYNATDGRFSAPTEERINEFMQPFMNLNVVVSVRRSKGTDIQAACGQLYYQHQTASDGAA
ncbi:MAG: 23S rRNA (adenine(2503)-C(2))-methyltransferase RlmN [candidate division KSB1 bacterium]|nr:23S rRNA (adenine(2503)-C(2))-methyltransferase RlmN [candidate division KSB1 bacterium]